MFRKIKYIFLLMVTVLLLNINVYSLYAADAGANAGNNSYINNNGVRIFPLGCRSRWSGFILYIVDGSGSLKSEVKVVVSQTTEPSYNVGESVIYTRLGEGSVDLSTADILNGGLGGYPPFDSNGNACGGYIRDWILSKDNGEVYNLYTVLEQYFDDVDDVVYKFVENDWYLIVEPFFWYGYYAEDEATGNVNFTGKWVCGTAPMIARHEQNLNLIYNIYSDYGSPYFKRYTNKNFPNCCRFSRGQFGIDVLIRGGEIKSMPTNDEIIDYGYGIMSFWAGDIAPEDVIPPTDMVEDIEKTVSIGIKPEYYTGNRVNGYDVSHSIPKDCVIRNDSEAASYYFEQLNVGVRKYTRKYSKPITLYEETVLADGSVNRHIVYKGYINTEASVRFEYLKEVPDIFKFTGMTVRNNVYRGNYVEYAENFSFINDLKVLGKIYNGNEGENAEELSQDSRLVAGNSHFILPEHSVEEVSAGVEAVINTVRLKKEDRACTNSYCDEGWIEDWEYCDECGGDAIVSVMKYEACEYCSAGKIDVVTQCGQCYGLGVGSVARCSGCNSQSFENYQVCGKCGTEGTPGDYTCFNCNGNGYTSRSWIEAWTEYVPDKPCGACDAIGYDEDGEVCYLCDGVKNAGTPYHHEGQWFYHTCVICGGSKTVFKCPVTDCDGEGSGFSEESRCANCGSDSVTTACEACSGYGLVADTISCATCGGDGNITTMVNEACDECDGGYIDLSYSCGTCGGDGIIQAGSSAITDTNRYFTIEEIMEVVKEKAGIVAEYIMLNSEVHNDRLTVKDNGNEIIYMNDESVPGANIIVNLEGSIFTGKANATESAAEYTEVAGTVSRIILKDGGDASESSNGVDACVAIAGGSRPTKIIMGMNGEVSQAFGTGSAPTGIEVHYENVMLGYDVEILSGKAVYGNTMNVDSIYNHVLSGYLGTYHNGGDPDDGYCIVVCEDAVEITTTPISTTTNPNTTTPLGTSETTTSIHDEIVQVDYFDIVDWNFTRQISPSSQLVDVMTDAEYYLTLDSSYYMLLAEKIEDNKYVAVKEMQFPFDVYYDGTYYHTDVSGYTEWIEICTPDSYTDVWDEGVNMANYESNNHWYVVPVYIPTWAKETDSAEAITCISIKVIYQNGEEVINRASVQLNGILYGFTITGINDVSQYYKILSGNPVQNLNYSAAAEKLEWRVGTKNRMGRTSLRYLMDGEVTDVAEDYQTLPIREGSGDGTDFAKTGDGEMSAGTSFSFIIKSISDLKGDDDYIEIIPHFKYVKPDGTIINDDELLILYEYSDTKWYVAGSNMEKKVFSELVECEDNLMETLNTGIVANLGLERFREAYYDAHDIRSYRYGNWLQYTLKQHNLGLPVSRRIEMKHFMDRKYITNMLGIARIPSGLRLYSGEFEQLAVNLDKEPEGVILYKDYNQDGIADSGYNEDEFRQSMQTWYGNYMVNENIYVVNKNMYPEFWTDGNPINPETDERIMRDGKIVIGFEINAYKNGIKHLTYGDMWNTEGQKRYTVKEYIPDSDNVNKKDPDFPYDKIIFDGLMIDYGDVTVVDINDKLADDYWSNGSFIIN